MPLYDYKCKNCGSIFTVLQSIHDDKYETLKELKQDNPTAACDPAKCDDKCEEVKRLIGSVATMNLKGAGFHCNDYGSKCTVLKGKKKS